MEDVQSVILELLKQQPQSMKQMQEMCLKQQMQEYQKKKKKKCLKTFF